jgi:hypothetical protein
MRVAARHKIMKIDRPLAGYRHTPGSLSMEDRTFLPQVLRVLDKAFAEGGALEAFPGLRRRAEAEQYFSASWMAFQRGARARAVGLLIRSVVLHPGRLAKEANDRLFRLKLLGRYVAGKRRE